MQICSHFTKLKEKLETEGLQMLESGDIFSENSVGQAAYVEWKGIVNTLERN